MTLDPLAFFQPAGGTGVVLLPEADEAPAREGAPRKARGGGGAPPDHGDGGEGGGGDDSWRGPSGDEPPPYRPRVPAETAPFALTLTLVGVTSLFLVFIGAFVMRRLNSPSWPPLDAPGPPASLWVSTVVLIASSFCMMRASAAARRARRPRVLRFLVWTLITGAAFVLVQLAMWISLARAGLLPSTNGYGAVFYSLTGLHAVHVLAGLGFLAVLALRQARCRATTLPYSAVRLGAVYWHFMAVVWLVVFAILYVPGAS